MESNISDFKSNVTINQMIKFLNISDIMIDKLNSTNDSEVSKVHLIDLYEPYKTKEREQLVAHKLVAYVVGALIILSNFVVVVSSGLILKKGQQPKSTYLLLGNVALADIIIGISLISGATVNSSKLNISSDPLCIFQNGMLVGPAIVSIFSVGLIAVDRYIYILHGLYYQRWFNTTRVRISIACIWMVGVILGFMPITGWVNKELFAIRCTYVAVYPGALILLVSVLSFIPIVTVTILYVVILKSALKNYSQIKASKKIISAKSNTYEQPKLRMCRGGGNKIGNSNSVKYTLPSNTNHLKRSASFNTIYGKDNSFIKENNTSFKTQSINNLTTINTNTFENHFHDKNTCNHIQKSLNKSQLSICSVVSTHSDRDTNSSNITTKNFRKSCKNTIRKKTEANKLRAITIVTLTSCSFIFTWTPFFVTAIFFVFCEEKLTNPRCLNISRLVTGNLGTLGFVNSIFNPLIYAWWHKGFQKSVRLCYRKYIRHYFVRVVK